LEVYIQLTDISPRGGYKAKMIARKHAGLASVAVLALLVCEISGYKSYQNQLPNGGNVPHPCKPNYIWQGVGHRNVQGGGDRNPFGAAFKAAGYTWSADLCNADSDDDGRTNGEELGDPDCQWSAGNVAPTAANLSHPGVCEPTDSADCLNKNGWDIDCSEGADFNCTGIDEPDTIKLDVTFTRTAVPAEETTYICQKYEIPSDKMYHLIATKPIIDNAYVMHHTILYGCPAEVDLNDWASPKTCGMASSQCDIIGGWTLGENGACQNEKHGIPVGKGYYTQILMEHHWNNPTEEVNYFDESGLSLYITPNIREQNIGSLFTGQTYLELPPGRVSWTVHGDCTESCLKRKLKSDDQSIFITSAYLHMHYLGDHGSIKHWRDGSLVSTWADEETYSYDTPITHVFDPPIEVKPGDRIETICSFNTMSRDQITYQGEATSDEMCFGIMSYYPREVDIPTCVSYKEFDECEVRDWAAAGLGNDNTNGAGIIHASTASLAFMLTFILSFVR